MSQWPKWLSRQYGKLEIWVRILAKAQIFSLKIINYSIASVNYFQRYKTWLQCVDRVKHESVTVVPLNKGDVLTCVSEAGLCTVTLGGGGGGSGVSKGLGSS